jgi:hypothetical protein
MKITSTATKSSLLAFMLVALTMLACKDDEEPEPPVDSNPIVGTWQLTAVTPETPGATIPALQLLTAIAPCIYDLKLTFNSNNSITTADCPAAVSAMEAFVPVGADAKWKVEGDQLILTRGSTSQQFKFTRTDTNLTVVVNTNTSTGPPVNALLQFKRV